MRRCYDQSDYHYPRWGGRGIKVTGQWHDVRVFVDWVEQNLGPRPSRGYSLNRTDNDGDYEPGNLDWATARQQFENATHLGRDPSTNRWVSLYK
jgi:hypothetical protein